MKDSPQQSRGQAQLVEEKDRLITQLQTTLQGKDREQKEMAEQITTLSR